MIGGVITGFIDGFLFGGGVGLFNGVLSPVLMLPSIAVSVRRLHDIDKSGWWVLLSLIPIVGIIVLIVWYVRAGQTGNNRFGDDPLAAVASDAAFAGQA